jgi:BRCT domain type II-containing protein
MKYCSCNRGIVDSTDKCYLCRQEAAVPKPYEPKLEKSRLCKSFSLRTSKKEILKICDDASRMGLNVEHRIKNDVDNIYINNQLVAEIIPNWSSAIIYVNYTLSDLIVP